MHFIELNLLRGDSTLIWIYRRVSARPHQLRFTKHDIEYIVLPEHEMARFTSCFG